MEGKAGENSSMYFSILNLAAYIIAYFDLSAVIAALSLITSTKKHVIG